jgi:hypothetical protein
LKASLVLIEKKKKGDVGRDELACEMRFKKDASDDCRKAGKLGPYPCNL